VSKQLGSAQLHGVNWDGVMWTGLAWLRIGTGGELVNSALNLRVP
jgi:hypothetical protein